MPVGNGGAGLAVAAGASPAAQVLLGRTVAVIGGAMYAQYRTMRRGAVSAFAGRHHGGRGCIVLRQPFDRARHG